MYICFSLFLIRHFVHTFCSVCSHGACFVKDTMPFKRRETHFDQEYIVKSSNLFYVPIFIISRKVNLSEALFSKRKARVDMFFCWEEVEANMEDHSFVPTLDVMEGKE
ncbi:hypothetical protein CK203_067473 [Vitis vinifera]|uniref:Uncharacterized protein n=1 Tax=Vitis vinifera TaxID=29760 RepID=A0A438EBH4_VITVI|nr:hypothetical protein CK203_067473 [Vitis vinifera]